MGLLNSYMVSSELESEIYRRLAIDGIEHTIEYQPIANEGVMGSVQWGRLTNLTFRVVIPEVDFSLFVNDPDLSGMLAHVAVAFSDVFDPFQKIETYHATSMTPASDIAIRKVGFTDDPDGHGLYVPYSESDNRLRAFAAWQRGEADEPAWRGEDS